MSNLLVPGYVRGIDFVKVRLYKVVMADSPAPSAALSAPPADTRSRRAILELLKWHGPQDAQTLAGRLKITAMAVRQHLYALTGEKLERARTSRGRWAARPSSGG